MARYPGRASPATTLILHAHVTPSGAGRTAEEVDRSLGMGTAPAVVTQERIT